MTVRYVAFLRGVSPLNLRIPDLKKCLENAGFTHVKTLLSSGNVAFDAPAATPSLPRRETDVKAFSGLAFGDAGTITEFHAQQVGISDAAERLEMVEIGFDKVAPVKTPRFFLSCSAALRIAVLPLILFFSACAPARFDRETTLTVAPVADARTRIVALADQIAREFGLSLDDASATANVRGYFGRPAHYYRLSMVDLADGRLLVTYRHEIRVASHHHAKSGPEEKFYSELRARLGPEVVSASAPADRP